MKCKYCQADLLIKKDHYVEYVCGHVTLVDAVFGWLDEIVPCPSRPEEIQVEYPEFKEYTCWYKAWRRNEAHMVAMTEDGVIKANERAKVFREGFEAGLKVAATKLELEHTKVKKQHSFFLTASRLIRGIK